MWLNSDQRAAGAIFLGNTFPWLFYSGLYSVRLVEVFLLDLKKFRIPLPKLCSLDYTIFQQLHNCVVKTRIWATTQLCSVDYTKKVRYVYYSPTLTGCADLACWIFKWSTTISVLRPFCIFFRGDVLLKNGVSAVSQSRFFPEKHQDHHEPIWELGILCDTQNLRKTVRGNSKWFQNDQKSNRTENTYR